MSKPVLLLCTLFLVSIPAISQTVADEDAGTALTLKKKFKEDAYAALSLTQHYSFDKGKNEFKQPVVTVKEEGSVEFIALKDIAVFQYYQFHNRFVKLNSFTRYDKYLRKYIQTGKRGFDRSVTDDNIFFDDSRMQLYSFRFLQKGKMAKLTWESEYTDGKYLTRDFFHEYFPVVERVIEFDVPSWLEITFIEKNFGTYKIEKSKRPSGKNTLYTFKIKDAVAIKSEYRDLGSAYTEPHILIQLKSFENDGQRITLFQTTKDLYAWYSHLYNLTGNEVSSLKAQVTSLTAGKKTDEEKIKAIYYWVQDNIRYIAYEDGFAGYIPAKAQDVFTEKYGDCKGMANLLTEMLKIAGYDARFTWIGTRHIPYDHSVPAMCVDNHAITTLYFKGKEYFLDGTEKYAPFGENAYRIQGKSALIEKGETFDEKKVPVSNATANKVKTNATLTLNNGALKGHVKITLTGDERKDFHNAYQDMPKHAQQDFLKEMLEFGNSNLTAANVKNSDLGNRDIPVEIEGDIDLTNNINVIGDNQYLGVDFFPKTLGAYMPDQKRTRGYDLESIFSFEDEIELIIPAGKKCIDLPAKLILDNPGYAFSGAYEVAGNKVKLKKTLTIKDSVIPATELSNWKNFLEQLKEFNSYLITVTK
ncbi:MAG TPA: transglutaminase-like domain-containing protein [Chitinophagaceae bacterium]